MLAKSRYDFIARHSALSAPIVFLPRLLLCCGLPQSSLLSMIERLGKLGDESLDRDKCFGEFLTPSATIEWGLGHISKRSLIARKLLGRISANVLVSKEFCTNSVKETIASSSFISWLTDECRNDDDKLKRNRSRKAVNSKGQGGLPHHFQSTSDMSATISLIFDKDERKKEIDLKMDELIHPMRRLSSGDDSPVTKSPSTSLFLSVNFVKLDAAIEEAYSGFVKKRLALTQRKYKEKENESLKDDLKYFVDGAAHLVNRYRSPSLLSRPTIFTETVLKWIPILSENAEEPFWQILFAKAGEDSVGEVEDMMDLLVTRCIASWSAAKVSSCQSWILQMIIAENLRDYSISLFLKCLINKSGQLSYCETPLLHRDNKEEGNFPAIEQQQETVAAVRLSLEGARCQFEQSKKIEKSRNILPDWMVLLLLIGKRSKKHLDLMTTILVDRLPSDKWEGQLLPGALLRLYSHFPSVMNLNNAKTRQILVNSAAEMASDWLQWRTPFDEQVECVILNLQSNPIQRQQQLLSDISKRYPLITCRHISLMTEVLTEDAAASPNSNVENRRGTIISFATAEIERNTVKVYIKQWGCEFSEPLWSAILDALMALPGEVIFVCGYQTGLLKLFSVYLKLFMVHAMMGDINPNSTIVRIKDKFLKLTNDFNSSYHSKCDSWLKSKLAGVLKNECTIDDAFIKCGMKVRPTLQDEG